MPTGVVVVGFGVDIGVASPSVVLDKTAFPAWEFFSQAAAEVKEIDSAMHKNS